MKIHVAGFGLNLTFDEIREIVNSISDNIHKDKKRLCLLLFLTNETLLGWYSAITKIFSPQLAIRAGAENRTLTYEELSSLIDFVQRHREFQPLVADITILLEQVENHYRNKHQERLAGQIHNVSEHLNIFSDDAIGTKMYWLERGLSVGRWDVLPEEIFKWETGLDYQRRVIRELTGSIEIELECGKEMIGQLLMQLRPSH